MTRLLLAMLLLAATWADAQEAALWLEQGHVAAGRGAHQEAITAYEKALAADPALGVPLSGRLGRQYLYADQPQGALPLLEQALQAAPGDCPLRLDHALALSWNNQLREARAAYVEARNLCPQEAAQASLGEARMLGWMGRESQAEDIYREMMAENTSGDARLRAELALASLELSRDDNRRALQRFRRVLEQGLRTPDAYEGMAAAQRRLGNNGEAQATLEAAQVVGAGGAWLERFADEVRRARRPAMAATLSAFHDRDGTNHFQSEVAARSPLGNGFVEVFGGNNMLWQGASATAVSRHIAGRFAGVAAEQRFSPAFALAGNFRYASYPRADFQFPSAELNAIVTPTDRLRFDLAVARVTIADTFASLEHHLTGRFYSGGVDWRALPGSGVSAAVDATQWSEGNRRTRLRLSPWHRFEGPGRIRISLPLLYQHYDRPFSFGLFSPDSYLELGPQVSVEHRAGRDWRFAAMGRAGSQRESGLSWSPIAMVELSATRALRRNWGVGAGFSHSNSNLASSGGFSRTRGHFGLQYRF